MTQAQSRTPRLVLLHGWGMNSGVWSALPPNLSARVRCHPIELPGHGRRRTRAREASLGGWADAVLAQAPPRGIWLGWSLGGLLALQAALRAPERVEALILMTATPRFVQDEDWPNAMPAETLAAFHGALLRDPSGTLQRFLALQVRGTRGARDTLRRLHRELGARPPPDPEALATGLRLLGSSDLRGALGRLPCPSLWCFGQRDTLVPATTADALRTRVPRGRFHVQPGAAHAPFLSHPQAIAETILRFLDHLPEE